MSGYGSDHSGRVIRELSRDFGLVQPRRAPSAASP
jgi:hypothetical protein